MRWNRLGKQIRRDFVTFFILVAAAMLLFHSVAVWVLPLFFAVAVLWGIEERRDRAGYLIVVRSVCKIE